MKRMTLLAKTKARVKSKIFSTGVLARVGLQVLVLGVALFLTRRYLEHPGSCRSYKYLKK